MMRTVPALLVAFACLAIFASAALTDDSQAPSSKPGTKKHLLRYKFHTGETLRWEVLHQRHIQAAASDTNQVTDSVSKSIKVWRVTEVKPDGTATFEHLVESVNMRNSFSGGQEVRYNSLTDNEPPPGFEDLAASIGVVAAEVTISPRGEILRRIRKPLKAAAQNQEGEMTVPFPAEAIPVGHRWSFRHDVDLPLEDGTVKKVRTLQTFKLASVKTGVATIELATKVLTPIHSPALEAKLLDKECRGTVRFDLDAGRVLRQQIDVDRRVIGFVPSNPASSLQYVTRFTEKLLPATQKTASRPRPQPSPSES